MNKIKICPICKKEFKLKRINQKYCSNLCQCEGKKITDAKHYKINKNELIAKAKKYRKIHREKMKTNDKYRYQKNKEKILEHVKIYRQSHKEEINQYDSNKRKTDIRYKLSKYLRRRLLLALKGNPKLETTLKLLGCSIEELKQHLEKQFTEGMSWDNHSYYGWHIDHIKPCASFDLSKASEQHKCFHYTNLQPLWAKENLSKGAK